VSRPGMRSPSRTAFETKARISSFTIIESCRSDPGNWDLVLIPELARSTRKVAESAFLRFAEFSGKLFGFAHHDDCIRTSFPSIAGSVVYRETRPRVGVQMAWLAPRSVKIRQESATRKFKESAYDINRNRNEYIAAVARNFAKGDVLRYGVPLSQDRPAVRGGQSPAIVILVETVEPGRVLQRFLPEGVLATHSPRGTGVLRRQTQRSQAGPLNWLDNLRQRTAPLE